MNNDTTNTVYIVSREKLIEFIENYIPEDAQFELRVLYEIMHRFVTPVDECSMMEMPDKCDTILNEKTQAFADYASKLEGFEPFGRY